MGEGGGGGGGGGYHGGSSGGSGEGGGGGFVCIVLILGVIVLIIVLPIVLTRRNNSSVPTDFFSPGDSRLVTYSSFFCDGINLEAGDSRTSTSANIATLSSPPSLTDENSFNVTDQRTLSPREFRFYQYYLYPNSNISISACSRVRLLDVYLVKGNDNAENWQTSPSSRGTEIFRQVLCPEGQTIMFNVLEEDEYYVFFYNSFENSDVSYTATIQYERFEYALPAANASHDECFALAGSRCTVSIPYGSGSQQALVTTTIPRFVDWGENVDIDLSCNQRGWAVAIVILIPLIVFLAVIGGIIAAICFWWHCSD